MAHVPRRLEATHLRVASLAAKVEEMVVVAGTSPPGSQEVATKQQGQGTGGARRKRARQDNRGDEASDEECTSEDSAGPTGMSADDDDEDDRGGGATSGFEQPSRRRRCAARVAPGSPTEAQVWRGLALSSRWGALREEEGGSRRTAPTELLGHYLSDEEPPRRSVSPGRARPRAVPGAAGATTGTGSPLGSGGLESTCREPATYKII